MTQQLHLIEPPSVEQSAPTVKSWQQSFAGIFWFKYKEVTTEECKLGFGALKKMLNQHAVKFWVDEETGEPEIPTIAQWTDEVGAFFEDSFAAKERGFHFAYLLKQYGSFKKFTPKKREAPSDAILAYDCTKCNHHMEYARSFWLRSINKVGKCGKCGTAFNVNDVLNQIPTINNFLPGAKK